MTIGKALTGVALTACVLLAARSASAQNPAQCRARADQVYADCINGGGNLPQTYRCIACYKEDEIYDSYYQVYMPKYCFKVYNTTNGEPILADHWCTEYMYPTEHPEDRCQTNFEAEARCVFGPDTLKPSAPRRSSRPLRR